VRYALVPHSGHWDQAGIYAESASWNEPLLAVLTKPNGPAGAVHKSLLDFSGSGWEVTAATVEGKSLLVRLFNAAGDGGTQRLSLDCRASKASLVELSGSTLELLNPAATPDGRTTIELAMPRFGVRTIKFDH